MLPFTLVFLLILGCVVAYFVQTSIRFGSFETWRTLSLYIPPVRRLIYTKSLKERYRKQLFDFQYFQELSSDDQEKFLERLLLFLSLKRIEGSGLRVEERMRVRVAACAIQVLFGLEEFYIPFFDTIRLYNGSFSTGRGKNGIEAIALRKGVICISWPAFEKGYESPHDAYNVGIFAFAQALQMGVKLFDGDDPYLTEKFQKWDTAVDTVIRKSRELKSPLLPASMIKNESMFFASGVEYFFEAPEKLYAAHPNLYYAFCEMLWQNPLKKEEVPPRQEEHRTAVQFRRQRRFMKLYILSFAITFLGFPFLIYLSSREYVPDLLLITIFFGTAGIFLFPKLRTHTMNSNVIFGAIGISGCTLMGLLTLNLIPISTTTTETHTISNYTYFHLRSANSRYGSAHPTYEVTYQFSDGAFRSSTLFRTFNYTDYSFQRTGNISFPLYRGLLGIKVFDH